MGREAIKIVEPGEPMPARKPVLAVGLGRGGGGKSTVLSELVWRAKDQGRGVIVADGDMRSQTLTGLFPDAMRPASEEMPDIKAFLMQLLNRMVKEQKSAVLDLGGGDRALQELRQDFDLVGFCRRKSVEPVAVYCLGPEEEDLSHCHTIWRAEYFRPERAVVLTNEGVIRSGQTIIGAFDRTTTDKRLGDIIASGARLIRLRRLGCMELVKNQSGFYQAASGAAGLDPVQEFMVEEWLADIEAQRREEGVAEWMP